MARAIWKGAISFGLVHIPVAVVSATKTQGVDFDWLDERSMEPVGYKRVNKVTGKEVTKDNIVKGVQYEKGRYVVLSEEEIRSAHPKSTQTIDIFAFVESSEIPLENIEKPYYLAPDKRGEKVYALLRETLSETNKVALANVVLHTKQHLAALMAIDSALVLILLRWPDEVRGLETLELNDATVHPSLNKGELEMAKQLVAGMTAEWSPQDYKDTFQEKIMQLVEQKASAGKIAEVESVDAPERRSADVIDLTELLRRSLRGESGSSRDGADKKSDRHPAADEKSPAKPKARSSKTADAKTNRSTAKKPTSKTSDKKASTRKKAASK